VAQLGDFALQVLDVELAFPVLLVYLLLFLLKFFVLFCQISPMNFKLETLSFFFVSFLVDKFLKILVGSLLLIVGNILPELFGLLLKFHNESCLMSPKLFTDNIFKGINNFLNLIVLRWYNTSLVVFH
jgi:hypothetical protein